VLSLYENIKNLNTERLHLIEEESFGYRPPGIRTVAPGGEEDVGFRLHQDQGASEETMPNDAIPGALRAARVTLPDQAPRAAWICATCGTQFSPSLQVPAECPICEDPRQFVGWQGQQWTTLDQIQPAHRNVLCQEEPGLHSIHTQPDFGIGQRAFLISTPEGNLLWDCVALLDLTTREAIVRLGGITAIAISHPHYYTTMVEWSRAFDHAPIYIHELDREWVMRPDSVIRFWSGSQTSLPGGATLIKTGGHFDGYQVLHWTQTHDRKSILLAGDQPEVCMDRKWVTFMYSYPNFIPLNQKAIVAILAALNAFDFDRLYAAFPGRSLGHDAKGVVIRSAERYLAAISS
jgi:hypothetical protein